MTDLPGSFVGLTWDDDTRIKIERVLAANPRASIANIAANFKVSVSTMKRFFAACQEAQDAVEIGRARGDNAIAEKNFSMALKGDGKAIEREMKKRGMIGGENAPLLPTEQRRDYTKLSVEELEMLARIDDKTRVRPSPEGTVREIGPPLHS